MQHINIEFIDLQNRLVVLAGGGTLPITELFDEDGDATEEIAEASGITFGSAFYGWYTLMHFHLCGRTLH